MQVTGSVKDERVRGGFGYGGRRPLNSLQLAFGEGSEGRGKNKQRTQIEILLATSDFWAPQLRSTNGHLGLWGPN